MGLFGFVFSIFGFGLGLLGGLVIGYFGFIYKIPVDVKKADVKSIVEVDDKVLKRMLPEIPLWVKMPDYDRVDWLNKFLKQMWPYLDKAVCKTVKDSVIPIIEEKKPSQVQSIEFVELTLGDLPPTFSGVKVYDTVDKEMIIEPFLKWAGNPNILIAVKAFGMTATVQMTEFMLYAQVRATFKPLVSVFPCFSRVSVSLMQKPDIDFSLKVVGGDAMAIPGLSAYVQEAIKDIIADMLLWPKSMEVLNLNIENKKKAGLLYLKIVSAKGLKNTEMLLMKSDPYVKVTLGPPNLSSGKTSVKKGTLNPVWDEDLPVITVVEPDTDITFQVFDKEQIGKPHSMGFASVPLQRLTPGERMVFALDVRKTKNIDDPGNQKARGTLNVEARYQPIVEEATEVVQEDGEGATGSAGASAGISSPPDSEFGGSTRTLDGVSKGGGGGGSGWGSLLVRIHGAKDLDARHNCNGMCKVTFQNKTFKTKVIKKNNNPRWDEEFTFGCDEPPYSDYVKIEVIGKSKIGLVSKEQLGRVDIRAGDAVNNRRINEWYQLNDAKSGKVNVELNWQPT